MRLKGKAAVVAACAGIIALVAMVVGFRLDAKGFAGNALAELAGVIISVLVGLLVLDRFVESDRRRRWELVADETARTLRWAFVRAGLLLYLRLPLPRPPQADPFTNDIVGPIQAADALRALAEHLRLDGDSVFADPPLWLPAIEDQVRLVRDGVMPRLLAIGDPAEVAVVSAVEARFQEVRHAVWMTERFGGEHIPEAVAALMHAMADAVQATATDEDPGAKTLPW